MCSFDVLTYQLLLMYPVESSVGQTQIRNIRTLDSVLKLLLCFHLCAALGTQDVTELEVSVKVIVILLCNIFSEVI